MGLSSYVRIVQAWAEPPHHARFARSRHVADPSEPLNPLALARKYLTDPFPLPAFSPPARTTTSTTPTATLTRAITNTNTNTQKNSKRGRHGNGDRMNNPAAFTDTDDANAMNVRGRAPLDDVDDDDSGGADSLFAAATWLSDTEQVSRRNSFFGAAGEMSDLCETINLCEISELCEITSVRDAASIETRNYDADDNDYISINDDDNTSSSSSRSSSSNSTKNPTVSGGDSCGGRN